MAQKPQRRPPVCRDVEKLRENKWNASPPQVTSYLTYRRSDPSDDLSRTTHVSPNCGLGWSFELEESFDYQKSSSNSRVQELVGQVDLTFQPNLCSSMRLSNFDVNVRVSYPTDSAESAHEKKITDVPIQSGRTIGTYTEPFGYKGQVHIEITLTFSDSDGLSLPTTPSVNIRNALHHSLDGPSFVDAKFYLFSAKVQGRPANPKPIFAKSTLLTDSNAYLHDLLSSDSSFSNGTLCDLREDVSQEIVKLDPDAYDYDSDSDLDNEEVVLDRGKLVTSALDAETESDPTSGIHESSGTRQDGRAFAINGTAYRTWKTFIFYTYTNDIHFNTLRSQRQPVAPLKAGGSDLISCSPKSMYRFADYADIPRLKLLAKEGVRNNLSNSTIVTELFSSFTFKLRGEDARSAWGALDSSGAEPVSPGSWHVPSTPPVVPVTPPTWNQPVASGSGSPGAAGEQPHNWVPVADHALANLEHNSEEENWFARGKRKQKKRSHF